MLFFPGAISSFFATVLFFVIVIGGGYSCVRIYYQKITIDTLSKRVAQYEVIVSSIDHKESFYKKNIEILQRNCGRITKPTEIGGKLNVQSLFDNQPR